MAHLLIGEVPARCSMQPLSQHVGQKHKPNLPLEQKHWQQNSMHCRACLSAHNAWQGIKLETCTCLLHLLHVLHQTETTHSGALQHGAKGFALPLWVCVPTTVLSTNSSGRCNAINSCILMLLQQAHQQN